jgi:hypothetical protein
LPDRIIARGTGEFVLCCFDSSHTHNLGS